MAERARLERDGDVGVLVIDSQPLNLFDAEMVGDILAGLDRSPAPRSSRPTCSRSRTGSRSSRSRRWCLYRAYA